MSNKKILPSDRFSLFRESLEMGLDEFAQSLEVSKSHVYGIENGSKGVSLKIADKLFEKHNCSLNWLYHGIGPQTIDSETQNEVKSVSPKTPSEAPIIEVVDPEGNPMVSVLDAKAAAGYPSHYQDRNFWSDLPVLSLPFIDLHGRTHIAIQVEGSSMEETIQSNDYILCYQIFNLAEAVPGEIYAVATQDGILCKRIAKVEEGRFTLRSDNPEYGDYTLPASSILQLWRVRYKISNSLRRLYPITPAIEMMGKIQEMDAQLKKVNAFLDEFFQKRGYPNR